MDPLVLGLNSHHADSSATLMNKDGIVAAICEERINRQKHCAVFPKQAIHEVLRIAGASMKDVTDLAFARDPFANKGAKLAFIAKNPRVGFNLARIRMNVNREKAVALHEQMGVSEADCRFNTHHVEHHLAHIASSYFGSGFERAAAVSIDGSGDWCSVMIAKCEGKDIQVLHRTHPPHSLGIFYTALCGLIGFNKFGEEYKVMGLAAYGEPVYLEELRKLATWDPERGVRLDTDCFTSYTEIQDDATRTFGNLVEGEIMMPRMWSDRIEKMFGPARQRKAPLTKRDHDMAASIQKRFEEIYMEIIRHAVERTGCRDIVLSGGCALNGVANGRVVMEGLVDRVYIHPAAGDDGTGAGAAAHVLYNKLGAARTKEVGSAYWGTGWTDEEIEPAVKASGLPFKKLSKDDLFKTTIDAFCSGKIVGWFQGREEWGPRALGNRSILCNPNWPDMKAILNARIKNREPFRPFAPAVLEERLGDIWEGSHPVPFMNIVYKTRPEWRQKLSAVNHEDNTGRVQTVRRDQNALYYDLIKAFGERTGIPVLLNTSFNENEPIVHTPEQAIACFTRTRMDCLGIGSYWYEKPADLAAKAQVIGAEN